MATHAPPMHACPAAQARPHAPQFDASPIRPASQPLDSSPSQSPYPAEHEAPQRPAAQVGVAFARGGHAFPHAPQWRGSVAV